MSAPVLYETTISHSRTTPVSHAFHYSGHWWLVDLDNLPAQPSFSASEHLGDPRKSLRTNVDAFLAEHQLAIPGGRVLMLTNPAAFNPLSVFWCQSADGELVATIAEVHNTYGERHAYLLRCDAHGHASTEKALYVSPFNDVTGSYTLRLPIPADTLDLAVTLHREGEAPFRTGVTGHRIAITRRSRLAAGLSARLTPLRIRTHGVRLWLRRLPIQPRPIHPHQDGVQ